MKDAVPRWKPGGGSNPSTPSRNYQREGAEASPSNQTLKEEMVIGGLGDHTATTVGCLATSSVTADTATQAGTTAKHVDERIMAMKLVDARIHQ